MFFQIKNRATNRIVDFVYHYSLSKMRQQEFSRLSWNGYLNIFAKRKPVQK